MAVGAASAPAGMMGLAGLPVSLFTVFGCLRYRGCFHHWYSNQSPIFNFFSNSATFFRATSFSFLSSSALLFASSALDFDSLI